MTVLEQTHWHRSEGAYFYKQTFNVVPSFYVLSTVHVHCVACTALSLLLQCAINYYTYGMCNSQCTVHYIRTIKLMDRATSITLCNKSVILLHYQCNTLLAVYYAMCHFYYTVQYISYTLYSTNAIRYLHVTLQCVTSVTQPNVPTISFTVMQLITSCCFHFMKCRENTIPL